ncbi:MAG TPA: hypothetical protein VFA09_13310 [Ktedonobacteraceae bacterium]|nr:hypothetical protein [Ktedonobacteraceae bacterium]
MDTQRFQSPDSEQDHNESAPKLHRRTVLKLGLGTLGLSAATLAAIESFSWVPERTAHAAPATLPDIQYDIEKYLPPAHNINGIAFRFGPVHSLFLTAQLQRTPTKNDASTLANALDTIESAYPFSPQGVFTFISYGLPYFHRLPKNLFNTYIPRLLSDPQRFALEEAVPGPTDVSPQNPSIHKLNFNIPVVIESNDLLFTIRSDSLSNLQNVSSWLQGTTDILNGQHIPPPDFSTLLTFTSSRLMFLQKGLPRQLADANTLPYAERINPSSPMWMGFADQQVDGSGPATITTFQGNSSARFTNTKSGDYFYDGSIQHLSHVIQDLGQFYGDTETFIERCQYMFRSDPIPSLGNKDQFKNGGGPAYLDNIFQGPNDAQKNAQGKGTYQHQHRMGHLTGLQRSSRAKNGTPIHIRMDGPGYDSMDMPDGSNQPKLQFTIFVPTADFFVKLRENSASLDLVNKYGVSDNNNGIERFLTATRRQNFLVPPRAHRAFPLIEFT